MRGVFSLLSAFGKALAVGLALACVTGVLARVLPVPLPVALFVPLCYTGLVLVVLLVLGKVPVRYNLRNLAVRWRITALTALAFTMVVGLLTVLLAFVNGMYRLTEGSGRPGNVMILADGATDELFSNMGYGDASDLENKVSPELRPTILRDSQGKAYCSREVYILANMPIPTAPADRPRKRFVQVRGIEDPVIAGKVHGLELLDGTWFSEAGVQELPGAGSTAEGRETAIQVVLGEGIARELGRDRGSDRPMAVGDLFELGPNPDAADVQARKWIVTGIMKSAGSTFGSEVWAKRELIGPMFGKTNYTSIVLTTQDAARARAVAKDLTDNVKPAVQAQPETEYYARLNETNRQFLIAIIFVAVIMAVGGVFGVMNTMFSAISQRIRDIGVLRILGFARWQILVSFFLESLVIAVIGGLCGLALGSLADGWTATSIVSGGQGGGKSVVLKLVVDAQILSAGLAFTLLMGGLGGLLPALSAMRLRPLDSLR